MCTKKYAPRKKETFPKKILLAGGYGYGNVGDEAELSRCLEHWNNMLSNPEIKVFSPNPRYTANEHNVDAVEASRNVWFGARQSKHYAQSDAVFRFWFWWEAFKAYIRAGLLLAQQKLEQSRCGSRILVFFDKRLLKPRKLSRTVEALLLDADVLHLVGGGYLTSMTKSRLWDHMLLIRIASLLGTRVVLSGQTTGPFTDLPSRCIARWGLKKADLIYVRDRGKSVEQLKNIGIKGEHIKESFDDALFCSMASDERIDEVLKENKVSCRESYVVVNFHHWGQDLGMAGKVTRRMAQLCDYMARELGEELILVPMHQSDIAPMKALLLEMREPACLLKYPFDFKITRGVMARAKYCLTFKHHPIVFSLGSGVPVIAIALDEYYFHKNEGALRVFGQERWVLTQKTFWDDSFYRDMLDQFISNLTSSRKMIATYRSELHSQDGELVERALSALFSGESISHASYKTNWMPNQRNEA